MSSKQSKQSNQSNQCNQLPNTHSEYRLRNLTIELALSILVVSVRRRKAELKAQGREERVISRDLLNYYDSYMRGRTGQQIFKEDANLDEMFQKIINGTTKEEINKYISSPSNFFKFALSVWNGSGKPQLDDIFSADTNCEGDDALGKMRFDGAKVSGCKNYDLISNFNRIVIDPDKELLDADSTRPPDRDSEQFENDQTLKCILKEFKKRIHGKDQGTPQIIIEHFPDRASQPDERIAYGKSGKGSKGGDKRKSRKRTRRRRKHKKYSKKSNRKLKKKSRKRKRKKRTRRRRR